jgi:hypothetical protein
MVHLVDDEEGGVAPELGKVQIRGCRDRLVGCNVPGQAAAGIGFVVGGPDREAMAQSGPPCRVSERFFGLEAQTVTRHHPADSLDLLSLDEAGCGDHREEGLAPTRRHSRKDVGDVCCLAPRNGGNEVGKCVLVRAQRPRG